MKKKMWWGGIPETILLSLCNGSIVTVEGFENDMHTN